MEYDDSVKVIDSPFSKKELPDGLEYGKIESPIFPDSMKVENNLLLQVAAYNSAFVHGDVETCTKYLYPDAFNYYRKFFPQFSDEAVIKELFSTVSGEMQDMVKDWAHNGIDYQITVSNLIKKVNYKDDVIIVFNVASNLLSEEVYVHTTNLDKTIGISHNGGKNWWIMDDIDELPTILEMRYPQEVINAVMDY